MRKKVHRRDAACDELCRVEDAEKRKRKVIKTEKKHEGTKTRREEEDQKHKPAFVFFVSSSLRG